MIVAQAAGAVGTGEAIVFWILGPIALAGALGMIFARNAVHSALMLVVTMFCLAVFYIVGQAPFLGFVQIIVYTGAVMMLFLFVLMLVGRDSSDSVVEVLRGQRLAGLVLGRRAGGAAGRRDRWLADRGRPGRAGRRRRQLRGQRDRHRPAGLHQVPVRVRAHLGAADHRRAGRDGADLSA